MAPIFTGSKFGFGRGASDAASSPGIRFSGTGGEISAGTDNADGYTYHYFKSSGAFVVSPDWTPGSVPSEHPTSALQVMVIAGGGAGGGRSGGGGGAGGIACTPGGAGECAVIPVTPGLSIPIVVGNGGNGQPQAPGNAGNNSSFGPDPSPYYIRARAGGQGANDGPMSGGPGGSGGGSHYSYGSGTGQQPGTNPQPWVSDYGHPGTTGGGAPAHNSGAGGGAGAQGADGSQEHRGEAGGGQNFPNFTLTDWLPSSDPYYPGMNGTGGPKAYYGGGGGAGSYPPYHPQRFPNAAGYGGGGIGGPANSPGGADAGIHGMGAGGGGCCAENEDRTGGNGGNGIVVIKYKTIT